MRSTIFRATVVGSLAVAPLVVSAMASAADTMLGDATAPTVSCGGPLTILQTATATGSPAYAVPAGGGVITSVRIPGPATATTRAFKLGRPSGANYTIVGSTDPVALAANQVLAQNVRIPAKAGDVLGVYEAESSSCGLNGAATDTLAYFGGNAATGSTNAYIPQSNYRLSVSAVVEPDADGDGYGDTTQDHCAIESTTQGTCAIGAVRGRAKVGKRLAAPAIPGLAAGSTERFQWYRLTKVKRHSPARYVYRAIAGAHGSKYKLRSKDKGTKVLVRITVTAPGGKPTTLTPRPKRVH